jgi:hypothetical protein
MLSAMVANKTRESIELSNGIVIEVHTASFRSTRGYSLIGVVCDEMRVLAFGRIGEPRHRNHCGASSWACDNPRFPPPVHLFALGKARCAVEIVSETLRQG